MKCLNFWSQSKLRQILQNKLPCRLPMLQHNQNQDVQRQRRVQVNDCSSIAVPFGESQIDVVLNRAIWGDDYSVPSICVTLTT